MQQWISLRTGVYVGNWNGVRLGGGGVGPVPSGNFLATEDGLYLTTEDGLYIEV